MQTDCHFQRTKCACGKGGGGGVASKVPAQRFLRTYRREGLWGKGGGVLAVVEDGEAYAVMAIVQRW